MLDLIRHQYLHADSSPFQHYLAISRNDSSIATYRYVLESLRMQDTGCINSCNFVEINCFSYSAHQTLSRWNHEAAMFEFWGLSRLVLTPTAVSNAAGQIPWVATLPPVPIRRLKAFSVSGIEVQALNCHEM